MSATVARLDSSCNRDDLLAGWKRYGAEFSKGEVEILEMVHHFYQPDVYSKGQFPCHAFEKDTRGYNSTEKEAAIIALSSSNTVSSCNIRELWKPYTRSHQWTSKFISLEWPWLQNFDQLRRLITHRLSALKNHSSQVVTYQSNITYQISHITNHTPTHIKKTKTKDKRQKPNALMSSKLCCLSEKEYTLQNLLSHSR